MVCTIDTISQSELFTEPPPAILENICRICVPGQSSADCFTSMPSKALSRIWRVQGRPAYDTLRRSSLVFRLDPRLNFGEARLPACVIYSLSSSLEGIDLPWNI